MSLPLFTMKKLQKVNLHPFATLSIKDSLVKGKGGNMSETFEPEQLHLEYRLGEIRLRPTGLHSQMVKAF